MRSRGGTDANPNEQRAKTAIAGIAVSRVLQHSWTEVAGSSYLPQRPDKALPASFMASQATAGAAVAPAAPATPPGIAAAPQPATSPSTTAPAAAGTMQDTTSSRADQMMPAKYKAQAGELLARRSLEKVRQQQQLQLQQQQQRPQQQQ